VSLYVNRTIHQHLQDIGRIAQTDHLLPGRKALGTGWLHLAPEMILLHVVGSGWR
jgi:hypothetical protein